MRSAALWPRRRPVAAAGLAPPRRAAGHPIADGARDDKTAVPLVGSVHQRPRRLARIRQPHSRGLGLDQLVVRPRLAPLLGGDPPARQGVTFQRLEPRPLRVALEVHHELQDQRAVVGEQLLEARDSLQLAPELRGRGHAMSTPVDRRGVPRVHEDANLALRRQVAPEAPVFRTLALLVGGLPIGVRVQPARVHPLVQQVDGLALAGAVDAGKQHDDGKGGLSKPLLDGQQLFAQQQGLRLVGLLAQGPRGRRSRKHALV